MHAQLDREGLFRRWSALAFVDGWDRPWRRRPADIARVVVGAVLVAVLTALVHTSHPLFVPHWDLAGFVTITLLTIAWLGLGLPGATVVLVAALRRRWWVPVAAAVCAVAGGLLMLWLRPTSPGSATVLIAATWAGVTSVWPLSRPTVHRWFAVGVTAWAAFEVATAQGSTADVLQALAIGFTVGCLARAAIGTVAVDPQTAVLAVAGDLGLQLDDVTADSSGLDGAQRFTARGAGGDHVVVDLYGRDYTQAQVWKGLLRYVWYRGSRVPVTANRLQRLEHHLAVLGQANASGGADLRVVAAGLGGPTSDAVLITCPPPGSELTDLEDVTADDLAGAWASLSALRGAGIAHRGITGRTVHRTRDARWVLSDLRTATLAAAEQDLLADRAALLAATARHTGVAPAVAAARTALGQDALAAVVPLLQPSALPRAGKQERHGDKHLLPELRTEASGAAGVAPPDLAKLVRVSPVDLAMVAGTLLGLWILVGELAGLNDIGQTLKGATWSWLAIAFVIGLLPNLTEASALAGAVAEPLPFRPLVGLRLADGFLGLVGGTVATTAAAIRFFQLRGLAASVAVTSGLLYSLTGFFDQMVLSLLALIPAHDAFTLSGSDGTSSGGSSGLHAILVISVVGLAILGVALAVPRVRRLAAARVLPQLSQAKANLRDLASRPAKLVQLFGSNAVSQILFAVCLGLCLRGFGGSASLSVLVLVNTAAALLGGLAPIPGGMGVVEAGLIAGLTAAGVPQQQAIAATFAYRFITAYLPPLWGWPAMVWLRRADYL
jgi:uncharacterized membrane protein YbhN (UPF0104 family)